MWVAPLGSRLPPYPRIMDEELTIRARYRGIIAREGRSTAPVHPDDRRSYDDPETSPPPSRPRRRSRKRRASRPAVCPGRFRPRGAPATAQGGRGEAQTATTPTAALPKAQAADSHPAVGEERPRRRLTAEEPAGSRQLRRAGQPRPRRTHPPGGGAAGSGTAAVPGPIQAEGQSCTCTFLVAALMLQTLTAHPAGLGRLRVGVATAQVTDRHASLQASGRAQGSLPSGDREALALEAVEDLYGAGGRKRRGKAVNACDAPTSVGGNSAGGLPCRRAGSRTPSGCGSFARAGAWRGSCPKLSSYTYAPTGFR